MQPLIAHAFNAGSVLHVTVAGLIQGDGETAFRMLADPVAFAGTFSDVKSCTEVARSQPRLQGDPQQLLSDLEVEQVARVHVLPRASVDAAMRVKLDCNHTEKQVKLSLLRGNMFLRSFEGLYAVLPLHGDGQEQQGACGPLPQQLVEALGPDCCKQLSAKLASSGMCDPQQLPAPPAAQQPASWAGKQPPAQHQQRSLVILHQRLQPALRPPPGLGGFVRGQVRRQFEKMYTDLHTACQAIRAPSTPAAVSGLADVFRSGALPEMLML